MKLFITALFLLISFLSFAEESISGSKSRYHYDSLQAFTPPPKDYYPFYINYIGRHGSRYISSAKPETVTYQVLQLANQQKQLTPVGINMLSQLNKIIALNHNQYGKLTELGENDIKQIANRMLTHYPTVFRGNHIEIMSTTSPRTIATAHAFLQPFTNIYKHLKITQQPEESQLLLRFFNYSPAYIKYKKSAEVQKQIQIMQQLPLTKQFSQKIIQRLFTPTFSQALNNGITMTDDNHINITEFVIALFSLYQESLSFSAQTITENNINFNHCFTTEEKKWLSTVVTAKNYLQIGPAFDSNGIQIKIAAPLLQEIIASSNYAIHHSDLDANFWFAHAETISPLATLMELEGTNQSTNNIEHYASYWQAEQIIPMGGNIQLIFYHTLNNTQPILVKLLLNEREIHLPIQTNHFPYYEWTKVNEFYNNKLTKIGFSKNLDVKDWLTDLN